MKNLLFILLFVPIISFGQNPVKVQVTQQKTFAQSFNEGLQAGAAARSARAADGAAQNQANANNYENIKTDYLIGNSNNYRCVIISKVTGWQVKGNRETVFKELQAAGKYLIVNPENPKRNYKVIPQSFLESSETLFLEWHRDAQGQYDRVSNLKLKDYSGKIIFEADYKNKAYSEMLKPLMSDYNFTKEMAIKKIKEFKELKDLEIISQQEYDDLVKELKPIILGK